MKKKATILTLLASVLVGTSGFMFGCGSKGNNKDTFKSFQTTLSTLKEDSNLFKQDDIYSISTNFYLNNFAQKNESEDLVADDQNYIILNAVGLNYIESYCVKLENIEGKYNYKVLNKSLDALNESYIAVKDSVVDLASVEENANYDIYNGYFADYKNLVKDFTLKVYDVATTLGDFLINEVKITNNIGSEKQTTEDLKTYFDYQNLLIYNDFCQFFMDSCEGQVIDNSIYTKANSTIVSFSNYILHKNIRELSNNKVDEYIRISTALNNERRLTLESIKEFSLYEYTTRYENSIDAYEKEESDADTYFVQLTKYFDGTSSYILNYYVYLASNITN